jgi:hypothetical protein
MRRSHATVRETDFVFPRRRRHPGGRGGGGQRQRRGGHRRRLYQAIGGAPDRANFVTGLMVVAWVDVALLVIAAALTFLLPRARREA